jgi:hypothetical protein
MVAVLDQMAEQMEAMREMLARTDGARATTDDKLTELAVSVSALTRQMEHGDRTSEALMRVAEGQEALLARLGEGALAGGAGAGGGDDSEARMRLRSIDVQLLRILEELAAGRQETVSDIRTDIAQLTRELRRARGGGGGGGGGAGQRNAAAGPGE